MNIFKKGFCRVYQMAFRAALPVLPYREPKILYSVEETAKEIAVKNIENVLLITDGFLRQSGATQTLENALAALKINCHVYDGTRPNPTVANVEEALSIYRDKKCTALLAFGGVGESGMGGYHGRVGFEAFSHKKSIVDKKTFMDLPMRYQPYNSKVYGKLLRMFLK